MPISKIDLSQMSGTSLPSSIVTASGLSMGKIGQVVTAQPVTSSFATSNTSYTDVTNLNASITPTATSSKVLVMVYLQLYTSGSSQGNTARLQLLRGSTVVNSFQASHYDQGNSGVQGANTCTMTFLDSPSSTSSVTYKVQIKKQEGSSATLQASATDSGSGESTPTFTLLEVLA